MQVNNIDFFSKQKTQKSTNSTTNKKQLIKPPNFKRNFQKVKFPSGEKNRSNNDFKTFKQADINSYNQANSN